MNIKERIQKEIEIQKNIEGEKCQDDILLKLLNSITLQSQWHAFIDVKFHSYGKLSYECHRFYYPKKELMNLLNL